MLANCSLGGNRRTDTALCDSSDADSTTSVMTTEEPIIMAYPDTIYESAKKIDFRVDTMLQNIDGTLLQLVDSYADTPGVLTFRGTPSRTPHFIGKVNGEPSKITVDWVFHTDVDTTKTDYGVWGGGTGWTGLRYQQAGIRRF